MKEKEPNIFIKTIGIIVIITSLTTVFIIRCTSDATRNEYEAFVRISEVLLAIALIYLFITRKKAINIVSIKKTNM